MENNINAVIFDMDGVLIDSEPYWEVAEKEVFSSLGVNVVPELSKLTKSMTTPEVTKFWYNHHQWNSKPLKDVENEVIEYVGALIEKKGSEIKGVISLLKYIKSKNLKIGLATNAPTRLIPIVLQKLNISEYFDFCTSAEFEIKGKPHPAIYLSVSKNLNVKPQNCIVFEDSYSGILSAKRAGMKTVFYNSKKNNEQRIDKIWDFEINSFMNLNLINEILNEPRKANKSDYKSTAANNV